MAQFHWKGTWKKTCICPKDHEVCKMHNITHTLQFIQKVTPTGHKHDTSGTYSFWPIVADEQKNLITKFCESVLINIGFCTSFVYMKWYRAHVPITQFNIHFNHVDKRHKLTLQEFIKEYELPNRPVIITGMLDQWRARTAWTKKNLLEQYQKVSVLLFDNSDYRRICCKKRSFFQQILL